MSNRDHTEELLARAREGDEPAFEQLFSRHRRRLEAFVRFRMDSRLERRLDPADVVQEAYLEAARRFDAYQREPEMSFYLWLRWIAREKIIQQYRRHLDADKRAIEREQPLVAPNASVELARQFISPAASPTQEVAARELGSLMEKALDQLSEADRNLVIWRSIDQLTVDETAELLEISRAAAGKRYLRALEKLRKQLSEVGLLPE